MNEAPQQDQNHNSSNDQQQVPIIQDNESNAEDFSEPLSSPAEPTTIITEPIVTQEPQPEPQPITPQLPAPPAETPSTSNNALIMQIKILSEYAKDMKRSMYAVSKAAGVHHEYVRKAVRFC